MTDKRSTLATFYRGWRTYQDVLIQVLAPLSPEQLAWRSAPGIWSLGEVVMHMVDGRIRWFHEEIGEGDQEFADLAVRPQPGMSAPSAAELVSRLQLSWQVMEDAIGRWTPTEWEQNYSGVQGYETEKLTRQWMVWHVIEHDLHHGGEVSLMLGMQGLTSPDL